MNTKSGGKKVLAKAHGTVGKAKNAAPTPKKPVSNALVKALVKGVAKTLPLLAGKSAAKPVAQPTVKPTVKPADKALSKSAAKSASRTGAKSVSKTAAKPSAKAAVKPSGKTAIKMPIKTPPKSTMKPPTKAPTKAPSKPMLKLASKPGKTPAVVQKVKSPAKSAAPLPKVSPKSGDKSKDQKSAAKVAVKNVNPVLQKSKKPEIVVQSKPKTVSPAAAPVPAARAPVPAPAAAVAALASTSAQVPLAPKAGRPSSRLAQLTVPSMAQSVASTAAKSSYSQTVAAPVIAPPLATAHKKDPKLANNWKTKPVEQLTDPELMSMPDSEYMNDKQMAVFRLKLSVLKQDILNSAGETTEHLREDTVVVPDPADRATIEEEHALELRTRDRERKLLKKIEQSINRIDAGDYGYCDETGEPIGVGRLLARPTATLSLEAQQRRELKQKMFGD